MLVGTGPSFIKLSGFVGWEISWLVVIKVSDVPVGLVLVEVVGVVAKSLGDSFESSLVVGLVFSGCSDDSVLLGDDSDIT